MKEVNLGETIDLMLTQLELNSAKINKIQTTFDSLLNRINELETELEEFKSSKERRL